MSLFIKDSRKEEPFKILIYHTIAFEISIAYFSELIQLSKNNHGNPARKDQV